MEPLPPSIAVDAAGNVYVGDQYNYRIREITPDGLIHTLAGNGTKAFARDGGSAANAKVGAVTGLAVDASGALYIADSSDNQLRC